MNDELYRNILEYCRSVKNKVSFTEIEENFNIEEIENIDDLIIFLHENNVKIIDIDEGYENINDEEEVKEEEEGQSDSLKIYLKEIGKIPLLSPEMERSYAKIIFDCLQKEKAIMRNYHISRKLLAEIKMFGRNAVNEAALKNYFKKHPEIKLEQLNSIIDEIIQNTQEYQKAKRKLIESNLRLVVNIAKQFRNRGLHLQDLINDGNVGLISSIDKFNYKFGFRLGTYVTWWIKQSIRRGLADKSRVIRLPFHITDIINKWLKVTRELSRQYEREPTLSAVAAEMNIAPKKLLKIIQLAQIPTSLDVTISESQNDLHNIIVDDNANKDFDALFTEEIWSEIKDIMDKELKEKERKVLIWRFGLDGETALTLEEIGDKLGISRERVRQIQRRVEKKIKKIYNAKRSLQDKKV